jgi:hypothetical protein
LLGVPQLLLHCQGISTRLVKHLHSSAGGQDTTW